MSASVSPAKQFAAGRTGSTPKTARVNSQESIQTAASGGRLGQSESTIKNFSDIRPALLDWLHGQDGIFQMAEQKTGVDREKLFYAACAIFALYMIIGSGAGFICNLIGFAYPAYQSVLAIRTERKDDDTQLLLYWTTFGFFSMLDSFSGRIYRVFPLYWLAKALFLLYLALPQTNGAQIIYVKYLDPAISTLSPLVTETLGRLGINV